MWPFASVAVPILHLIATEATKGRPSRINKAGSPGSTIPKRSDVVRIPRKGGFRSRYPVAIRAASEPIAAAGDGISGKRGG